MLIENIQDGKDEAIKTFSYSISFVHEDHRSALRPRSASLANSRKWHHHRPRYCGPSLISVISDCFPALMTSQPIKWSLLKPQTRTSWTQAICTLPCLHSSSPECLSMMQWSLYHDTKLQSGRWPEPIPFSHSSFRYTPYFMSIFVFHDPVHFIFIHCHFRPHHSVFYISFQISFHSFLLLYSAFVCSANFIVH